MGMRKNIETFQISACLVCGNTNFYKLFTKKGREFWRCVDCGLEKQYPLPRKEDLELYYNNSYIDGMYKIFTDAREMKILTAEQRFKEIRHYYTSGRWLDIGCSDGVFVEFALQKGLDAEGIDMAQAAIESARNRGLPVFCTTIDDFRPVTEYAFITAFDVLEHVLNPLVFLKAAYDLLISGGIIAISLPNQASFYNKLMGRNWFFYIPEEHLHFFNPRTVKKLFIRAGFEIIEIKKSHKPLTFNYSLTQFKEYNPTIFTLLSRLSQFIPGKFANMVLPIYIGEMMIIAKK
jgi:2-polyprenyl-3-methyl-5-hydroxy-6-metoxy-1,4-benzoquinol methylase